jgi:hypothetical protein
MDRVSVSEAASRLGVTPDAVRQRIRRGTIEYEKAEDGRYYVYLTEGDGRRDGVQDALVDRLINENEFLRRELERKDTIIMSLTQRIPELEPASDPRESPLSPSGGGGGGSPPTPSAERPVSWLRRFFGL